VQMRQALFTIVSITILCVGLGGCSPDWHVSLVGINNNQPILCFSTASTCDTVGVQLHSITIEEMDSNGNAGGGVWVLLYNPASNQDDIVSNITYGEVPKGWTETQAALALKNGHSYLINKRYVLTKSVDGLYRIETNKEYKDNSGT
jgi:hypothetical protein